MKRDEIRKEIQNLIGKRMTEEIIAKLNELHLQLRHADELEKMEEVRVFRTACDVFGVTMEEFKLGKMKRKYSDVRKFVAYRLLNTNKVKSRYICQLIQIKRVSVIRAIEALEDELPFNKDLRAKWELFNELLDVSCRANDRVA